MSQPPAAGSSTPTRGCRAEKQKSPEADSKPPLPLGEGRGTPPQCALRLVSWEALLVWVLERRALLGGGGHHQEAQPLRIEETCSRGTCFSLQPAPAFDLNLGSQPQTGEQRRKRGSGAEMSPQARRRQCPGPEGGQGPFGPPWCGQSLPGVPVWSLRGAMSFQPSCVATAGTTNGLE